MKLEREIYRDNRMNRIEAVTNPKSKILSPKSN
jgi:hypothetical protein